MNFTCLVSKVQGKAPALPGKILLTFTPCPVYLVSWMKKFHVQDDDDLFALHAVAQVTVHAHDAEVGQLTENKQLQEMAVLNGFNVAAWC